MRISYPPILVHILILIGSAKQIKFLAVSEVRPNLTSSSAENREDFQNLKRGKISDAFFNIFIQQNLFEDINQITESPQHDSSEKNTTNNPDASTSISIQNIRFVCSKPALRYFSYGGQTHLVGIILEVPSSCFFCWTKSLFVLSCACHHSSSSCPSFE